MTVKAFRALVSGEDAGLKDAHQHFRKAVQHGRDIVQNATLSSVEQTKANTQAIHTDIRKTLSFVEGSERSMSSVAHGTERINRYLDCECTTACRPTAASHHYMQAMRETLL